MRKILVTVLFFASIHLFAQAEYVNSLSVAKQKAAQENKTIMIVFSGSDWCIPCMHLEKEILNKPDFESFAKKKLVMLNADFPLKNKNKKLISKLEQKNNAILFKKYNLKGIFPLVVLLNSNGKFIADTGYKKMTPIQYANYINSLIVSKNNIFR